MTPTTARGRRPTTGAWIAMPLLIAAFAAVFAALFSPLISWALGHGSKGTFVARFEDCHKGCAWIGDFISSEHKVVAHDVRYVNAAGLPDMRAGTAMPAVDVSSALFGDTAYPGRVTLRDALWPAVLPAEALAVVVVLMFAGWIWVAPVRYWRWRTARAGDPPGLGGTPQGE